MRLWENGIHLNKRHLEPKPADPFLSSCCILKFVLEEWMEWIFKLDLGSGLIIGDERKIESTRSIDCRELYHNLKEIKV